jgi:hypothetical protein
MKVTIPFVKSEIFGLAFGAGAAAIAMALFLLHASLFDFMPFWVKVGIPAGSWIVVMIFFLSHRSRDGKTIEFKTW